MFKNRSLQVQMVKTPKQNHAVDPTQPRISMTPEKITQIVKENAKQAAVGFVAVYAAVKVLNTASEIAINAAPKR